jgi:hypothetical protein
MSKDERIIFRATAEDLAKLSTLTKETNASTSEVMRAVLRAATAELVKRGLEKAR